MPPYLCMSSRDDGRLEGLFVNNIRVFLVLIGRDPHLNLSAAIPRLKPRLYQ